MRTTTDWTPEQLADHERGMAKVRRLWRALARATREQAAEDGKPQAVANTALMVRDMLPQATVQALLIGAVDDMLDREEKGAE